MNKIKNKSKINALVFLFSITYMTSYITRINYGAVISAMESATGFSKSMLSMPLTGSFITYGLGQIISGFCGDRNSPKKLVTYGLVVTVLMNLMMPLCDNSYQMLAVWSINGFAQSFMWPPLVKIMTEVLSDEDYKKAVTKVSWGSSIGTIMVYLISPLLISTFNWESVFVFSAIAGIIMIFLWNRYSCDVNVEPRETKIKAKSNNVIFSPFFIFIMIAVIIQGMLRDGVTTWMPSYICETYNLTNEISILTGVVLPVFSIISFQFATYLYTKKLSNPILCAGLFFAVGALAAVVLSILSGACAWISVLMFAILTGCMHGVNLMLVCMMPMYFQKTGKVSTISGIINSCTYVGSALSIYEIARLSERLGWSFTLGSWIVIALLGMIISLVASLYRDRKII